MRGVTGQGSSVPGFIVVALWAVIGLVSAGVAILLGQGGGGALEDLPPGTLPEEIGPEALEGLLVTLQVVWVFLTAIFPFFYWLVLSLVMQLVTRFFGGEGSLARMLGAIGAACIPFVVLGLVQLPLTGVQVLLEGGDPSSAGAGTVIIGLLSFLLYIAALVWHVALVVVGAGVARQISFGQSGGSCAISCAAAIGIPLLLLVLLVAVAALIGGAAG
jgi:hypothetical protein